MKVLKDLPLITQLQYSRCNWRRIVTIIQILLDQISTYFKNDLPYSPIGSVIVILTITFFSHSCFQLIASQRLVILWFCHQKKRAKLEVTSPVALTYPYQNGTLIQQSKRSTCSFRNISTTIFNFFMESNCLTGMSLVLIIIFVETPS